MADVVTTDPDLEPSTFVSVLAGLALATLTWQFWVPRALRCINIASPARHPAAASGGQPPLGGAQGPYG